MDIPVTKDIIKDTTNINNDNTLVQEGNEQQKVEKMFDSLIEMVKTMNNKQGGAGTHSDGITLETYGDKFPLGFEPIPEDNDLFNEPNLEN
jgi:hypothetical protein